jgi:hypothetical protein
MSLLDLGKVKRFGDSQIRVEMDGDVMEQYADVLRADHKAHLPDVDVFFDGEIYWLADGYHRCGAYSIAGRFEIPAVIHEGTRRDALRFALGANNKHGLRRAKEDNRKAILIALEDEEWGQWSNYKIAELCNLSEATVRRFREGYESSLRQKHSEDSPVERIYVTKHGTKAKMRTAKIGKARKAKRPIKAKFDEWKRKKDEPSDRWLARLESVSEEERAKNPEAHTTLFNWARSEAQAQEHAHPVAEHPIIEKCRRMPRETLRQHKKRLGRMKVNEWTDKQKQYLWAELKVTNTDLQWEKEDKGIVENRAQKPDYRPDLEAAKKSVRDEENLQEEERRFDLSDEAEVVFQMLTKRRDKWPEKFRHEFTTVVRTCVERLEAEDNAQTSKT